MQKSVDLKIFIAFGYVKYVCMQITHQIASYVTVMCI